MTSKSQELNVDEWDNISLFSRESKSYPMEEEYLPLICIARAVPTQNWKYKARKQNVANAFVGGAKTLKDSPKNPYSQ